MKATIPSWATMRLLIISFHKGTCKEVFADNDSFKAWKWLDGKDVQILNITKLGGNR